jgi:hydrogenase expression/formation protein HypD
MVRRIRNLIHKYAEDIVRREKMERIKIMNFCGTHEWTTVHYGIRSLLPSSIELVPGPGCPVCVTPGHYVEEIVKLAMQGVIVYTYGDSFRLQSASGSGLNSLAKARSAGGDVRVVYSFLDAVRDAREHGKTSVFFGVGFETTVPSYGLLFLQREVPDNLKFLSACRLTPPAMKYTIKLHQERGLLPISGVIAPGHVSTVIGAKEWEFLPRDYKMPTVVAGFEPVDVLLAVAQILLMVRRRRPAVENEYKRLVRWDGNPIAKKVIAEIFRPVFAAWRGIGFIPRSGLRLAQRYQRHDAFEHFGIPDASPSKYAFTHAHHGTPPESDLPPNCRCGEVVTGISKPTDCPLFLRTCTPSNPWGPCMVSTEGTCFIWAKETGGG